MIVQYNNHDLRFLIDLAMKLFRAYKTRVVLNNHEASYFMGCAGFSRFVFNWGLAEWKRQYENGEKPNAYAIKKQFNGIKDQQFPWVREYPYVIEASAFINLGIAFQNFFRHVKNGEKPGYPKFKKKNLDKKFTVRGNIHVENDRIKLPRVGWIRLAEHGYLPTTGVKILSANLSQHGADWFISLQVEEEVLEPKRPNGKPMGIDLGIKSLAVCSDGTAFDNPKTLSKYEKKLGRLGRELNRRKLRSNNWRKTKDKIAKAHQKIANVRHHTLHNISRYVTAKAKPKTIVIEDLNVLGMMRNGHLAKAIADSSLGELRRQIEYKAEWNGNEILVADRWYPSSKRCSHCGTVKETLSLSERIYTCAFCGNVINRDLNAALNLAALVPTAEAAGLACGVSVNECATVKQEGGTALSVSPPAVGAQALAPSYI